jgi:hypothetical protein
MKTTRLSDIRAENGMRRVDGWMAGQDAIASAGPQQANEHVWLRYWFLAGIGAQNESSLLKLAAQLW